MRTKAVGLLVTLVDVPVVTGTSASNGTVSYLIGGIIAFLIIGYLIYTLLRPDKF
jgi:K+-transporting ATPase KdpF subunit